ncbi:MAG: cysteine--tRNA ligase [Cyanobacteria bacterium P01_D01_bin.73]
MTLKLYNTLSRTKEEFRPIYPYEVKMYCCGVTVYDYCHLGHARSYVVWDTLRRYLRWCGYRVQYVQNFTDIDDKILKRARREESTMEAVSEKYIEAYFEDMERLNVQEADSYPRATHTLDGIKRLIQDLETKEIAYPADGDVYFSVRKFADYGKLSGRNLDDLQAGASGRGGEGDSVKRDPFDFALWKSAKPGEPAWESPWGSGRPGWHIECSAMVRDTLGETIDIHTGGSDLTFPHHENEIAQSEAASGHALAHYWLHNGMVNVGGEKMSKSLGNFTTIRQLLDCDGAPDPMAIRLFILQAQYRKPMDFTDEAIASAVQGWGTLVDGLSFGWRFPDLELGAVERGPLDGDAVERFKGAMDDDLNTPEAIAVLFELAKPLRKVANQLVYADTLEGDPKKLGIQWRTLVQLSVVLGLQIDPEAIAKGAETDDSDSISDADIEDLIAARKTARGNKDFAEADRIRDELREQGITLIDRPGGETGWVRE